MNDIILIHNDKDLCKSQKCSKIFIKHHLELVLKPKLLFCLVKLLNAKLKRHVLKIRQSKLIDSPLTFIHEDRKIFFEEVAKKTLNCDTKY